jgi:KaiC/GvpD/RAD55 family RecA-like ATPase
MTLTVKEELIKRSPLRLLEKSISGGLGKGNIGVLASRKGVGKTACLVHIAADQLLQGKHVIHVSYASRVDHIMTWYEDIFKEIAKKPRMKSALEMSEELIRNRVIMNFR